MGEILYSERYYTALGAHIRCLSKPTSSAAANTSKKDATTKKETCIHDRQGELVWHNPHRDFGFIRIVGTADQGAVFWSQTKDCKDLVAAAPGGKAKCTINKDHTCNESSQ